MSYAFLKEYRRLPAKDPGNRVVQWHVFREEAQARDYAGHIHLGVGQQLAGGIDSDTIGQLWWVGVEVQDLASWGNRAAVNKHAQ
jgi:hypothetical protein